MSQEVHVMDRLSELISTTEAQIVDYQNRLKTCDTRNVDTLQERILYFEGRLSGIRQAIAVLADS